MFKNKQILVFLLILVWTLLFASATLACGGASCTNSPASQRERIIFLQDENDTTTAIIQLNYEGDPNQFSSLLPIKSAINVQTDVLIPDMGIGIFDQVSGLTDPRYIAPYVSTRNGSNKCRRMMREKEVKVIEDYAGVEEGVEILSDRIVGDYDEDDVVGERGVEVLSAGIVGDYDMAVVSSDDPDALIAWLNDNRYTVTSEMKPLITVYVEEGFNFLAVKLVAGSSRDDILPLQITYEGETPMIPLRISSVGAEPNVQVLVWIFAKTQAVPLNYESIHIPDKAVVATFSVPGSSSQDKHDYWNVMNQMVDEHNGRAFVTEYAQETKDIELDMFHHGLLPPFMDDYDYLTRFNTLIDPDQMTIDPIFGYDASLKPLDRIHDFSDTHRWLCDVGKLDAELVPIGEYTVRMVSRIIALGAIPFGLFFLIKLTVRRKSKIRK